MDDIETRILDAWRRVKPRLMDDAAELKRRLGRCGSRSLSRPPRAWCLAIRASDRRLNDYQDSPLHAGGSVDVYVDIYLLRHLCRTIEIQWGGDTWDEVARSLGVGFTGLINTRLSGKFRTRHVRRLGGRWGPPVPILSCDEPLDPNARGFATPDPAWGWTGTYLTGRVPMDFQQCLTRVPVYHPSVARRVFDDTMHPEVRDSPPRQGRARLPPPAPDHVWYKWSTSNVYLGDDPKYWRKSPDDPGTPPPPGALVKPKRKRKPRQRLMRGSLVFRGWMWLCPKCGRKVRVLYLPLRPLSGQIRNPKLEIRNKFEIQRERLKTGGLQPSCFENWELFRISDFDIRVSSDKFACYSCHRVRCFSRVDAKNSWNELVSYLSGGLLYGHEVEKPDWFAREPQRKREYRPRANRPAPRREQVLRRMLNGWTITQIAADLKMCKQQVCDCIRRLCRQENVRNRRELALKLGSPHFQPMDSDRKSRQAAA